MRNTARVLDRGDTQAFDVRAKRLHNAFFPGECGTCGDRLIAGKCEGCELSAQLAASVDALKAANARNACATCSGGGREPSFGLDHGVICTSCGGSGAKAVRRSVRFYRSMSVRLVVRGHRLMARQYLTDLRVIVAGGGNHATDEERWEAIWHYATLVQFYRALARSAMGRAS